MGFNEHTFVRRLPVIRGLYHAVPLYHTGSVVENRLGLQIYRILGRFVVRRLRRVPTDGKIEVFARILDRDGILVIENFLRPEQFQSVVTEFNSEMSKRALKPYKNTENAKLFRYQLKIEDKEVFPTICRNFQRNDFLNLIASVVIRHAVRREPDINLDVYQNLNEQGIDNDVENILHADLHIPTVKMFFYINEVNEKNGAFIYAKGSHRLTWARLWHEYDMSVREARIKRGLPVPDGLVEKRAAEKRNIISPDMRRKMNVIETQICVKPNTLVIANNMGFHRRGEFTGSEPRKSIMINYRNSEQPFW